MAPAEEDAVLMSVVPAIAGQENDVITSAATSNVVRYRVIFFLMLYLSSFLFMPCFMYFDPFLREMRNDMIFFLNSRRYRFRSWGNSSANRSNVHLLPQFLPSGLPAGRYKRVTGRLRRISGGGKRVIGGLRGTSGGGKRVIGRLRQTSGGGRLSPGFFLMFPIFCRASSGGFPIGSGFCYNHQLLVSESGQEMHCAFHFADGFFVDLSFFLLVFPAVGILCGRTDS